MKKFSSIEFIQLIEEMEKSSANSRVFYENTYRSLKNDILFKTPTKSILESVISDFLHLENGLALLKQIEEYRSYAERINEK